LCAVHRGLTIKVISDTVRASSYPSVSRVVCYEPWLGKVRRSKKLHCDGEKLLPVLLLTRCRMFRKKTRQRLKRLFALALASLILNLSFPTAHPAEAKAAQPTPVHSTAGIDQSTVGSASASDAQLPTVKDKPAKRRLLVRASAYSSTVGQTDNDPFTAASGAKVHDGMIAMNGIPFGTKIRIPDYYGDKVFTVEDRMNARWGNRKIDIWMSTRAAAIDWGVRTVTIEIL